LQSLQILYTFVLRAEIATIFGPHVGRNVVGIQKYTKFANFARLTISAIFPADNFSKNKTKVIPNKECKILTHLHTICKKNCIFRIKSDSSSAVFCKVLDISLNNDKICREISEDKISNLSENFGSTKREIFGFELSMFESERHAK
jgi:hypothetical protein